MKFKLYLHAITIVIIEIGLCVIYFSVDKYTPIWTRYYYAWDKTIQILMIGCLLYPVKTFKLYWIAIGIFFALRLLWEIPAIYNYADACSESFRQILLGADLTCIFLVFVIQFKRQILCIILVSKTKIQQWLKLNS